MPAVELKRGRGRPKGSRVVKNRAPARRSMRGTMPPRTQQDEELLVDEQGTHNHESPARDGSSSEDAAWELQRQLMLDEFDALKKKCSDLEETLKQTQEESGRIQQASQEATNARENQVEELQMSNSSLLRRAREAEGREAELKEEVEILRCGQPWPSAPASSSRTNPAPSSSRPYASTRVIDSDFSAQDHAVPPRRTQPPFDNTRTRKREPQKRTKWSEADSNTLIGLIGRYGGKYSEIENAWKTYFPARHPRDQTQIKDKARNLKIWMLRDNLPLTPGFDKINIDAKGKAQIKDAGRNPDRKEADVDKDGRPINTYLVEELD